jgi:phospholipid/cholesterol/gamma-HCH transport system ATP-binding protein
MALAQKVADRVLFLHEGKKVYDGPPGEMKDSEIEIVRDFMHLDSMELLDEIRKQ